MIKKAIPITLILAAFALLPALWECIIFTAKAPFSAKTAHVIYRTYEVSIWLWPVPGIVLAMRRRALRNTAPNPVLPYIAAAMLLALPLGLVGLELGKQVRISGLKAAVQNGEPLVQALDAFTAQNGSPPQSLAELVPDYIDAIPTTGIPAYPRFSYHAGRDTAGRTIDYEIYLDLGGVYARWAMLRYRPHDPDTDKSQPILTWAYYDE